MRWRWFIPVLLLIGAAALGYVARPQLDSWRSGTSAARSAGHYQCSMHPQIVSDQPGTCPICGMPLQRVDELVAAPTAAAKHTPLFYRHPMRADVTSPAPAKDEMGMDFIPVYADTAEPSQVPGHAGFALSTERQQLIGVTRARVERRRLDSEIRAVGTVAYDPALYQAIVEYREALAARRELGEMAMDEARKGAEAIVRSATLRLRQLGVSDQQLRDVVATGRNPVDLLLPSTTAWVYAQVYEYEMELVRPGQPVSITTPAQRGRTYSGRVIAIDPILNTTTRTARVRIQVPSADASLRPESFVQATIHVPSEDVVAVPADAVLPRGEEHLVFVVTGSGTFTPRIVQLGREAGRYYEVLKGLQPGDEVVTSANFLIDSESRFRSALAAFSARAAEGAGAAATPARQ
jgi:multidrug efflux pump subunit AcrA (membrane-fusion protein)